MFRVQRSPCWPGLPGTHIGGLTFIVTAGLPVTESASHEAPGGVGSVFCCVVSGLRDVMANFMSGLTETESGS